MRWGRTSCSNKSKLIYHGQMAGPHYTSSGGGTNYQCLPSDMEYDSKAPSNLPNSKLRGTIYELWDAKSLFGVDLHDRRVPCAVCETIQRVNQLMIPAKTQCPSDEWTLDYKGFLMSSAETGSGNSYLATHNRGMYVCVDVQAQTGAGPRNSFGERIYPVSAACDGDGAITNCPTAMKNNKALSCVVCSK